MWRSPTFWRLFGAFAAILLATWAALGWMLIAEVSSWLIAAMAVVALAGAFVITALLTRRLRTSLVELANAAQQVGAGHYGKRVFLTSPDELGALATAFNEMSEAAAEHVLGLDQDRRQLRAILRSMVEGVLVIDAEQCIQFINEAACGLLDVEEKPALGRKIWEVIRHRQMTEAVERILAGDEPYRFEMEWGLGEHHILSVHGARLPGPLVVGAVLVLHDITHLRKLERVRQDFVANVSHELKTPLAAIQATVETLLDGAIRDPDHNIRFLERIRENSDRLYRLVQDLLTLGRIESAHESMNVEPISLSACIDACVSRQSDRAKSKGITLDVEPPPEPILATAEEESLAEILDNLVDNAIKYTQSGGRITLRWFSRDDNAIVQVEDTGVGIPQKDLSRIFERFYRVDKARSRQLGGTGLGLSIVKHLVQKLGGSISAESQVGEGSVFTVRLPRAEAEASHSICTESS